MVDLLVEKILAKLSGTNLATGGLLLLTALGSALYAYFRTVEKKSFREFFEFLLPHEIIFHPSAKADFLFWITRRAIMPFLMFPAGAVFLSSRSVMSPTGSWGAPSVSPSRCLARPAR